MTQIDSEDVQGCLGCGCLIVVAAVASAIGLGFCVMIVKFFWNLV